MILFMLIFSAYSANIVLAETDGNVNDLSIKENEQKELMKAEYPSSLTLLNDYPTYTSSDLKTSQYLDTRSFDSDSNLFSSDTELDACACDKDCNTVSENSNYTSFQNFDSIRSSLTPHNPITISSDEDFISHGF